MARPRPAVKAGRGLRTAKQDLTERTAEVLTVLLILILFAALAWLYLSATTR